MLADRRHADDECEEVKEEKRFMHKETWTLALSQFGSAEILLDSSQF